MYFTRKSASDASMAILKEQRQLRKERLLASPGLIIGCVGFVRNSIYEKGLKKMVLDSELRETQTTNYFSVL